MKRNFFNPSQMMILTTIDDNTTSWDFDAKPDVIMGDEDLILPEGELVTTEENDILVPPNGEGFITVDEDSAYY